MSFEPKYKRVILKISGEVLGNKERGETIDPEITRQLARQIKHVHDMGVDVGLVVGGGNIFRGLAGANRKGVDRTTGDYMGMLATAINGMGLRAALEIEGVDVRVLSAIPMQQVAEPFILRRAMRHMEKGRIVIFVAGTGNPYFSTDTAAALRASEIGADIILKATKVDGVYDKDPAKHADAVRFENLTYIEALQKRLNVMDSTAFSLCMDNQIPIMVFDLNAKDGIQRAVSGESIGTLVHAEG